MKKIKNIIFDYGNVIFEIDFKRAQKALLQLGIENIETFFAHKNHDEIFNNFETAAISPAEFRAGIRAASSKKDITDEQIDAAWNSLLIGVPENVHEVLLRVKENYRTFLLSNNNEIHYNWIVDYLKREFNMPDNTELFEKAYYSQQMFLRKPHVEIFEKVLKENNLNPEETLFIDDSPQHLVGAKAAGMQTLLMTKHPKYLEEVLKENDIL
ncbi:HAD family phosphatase [Pedobacter gandavensis]|uniref:HAD family hydrolase n=1 Tax=Pedobacter gandavensis TaxID=2679963 RepID=UPI00292E1908|nr:HAD family phosphatase [Pedobacter gandavensis]